MSSLGRYESLHCIQVSWPILVVFFAVIVCSLHFSPENSARQGYDDHTKAHEYCDEPDVLLAKVKLLASLIRQSAQFATYTGAGISTASGIDDYAR